MILLNPKLRLEVLERDKHICQQCFTTDKRLDVHHIIPTRLLGMDIMNNLISVCRYCHRLIEIIQIRTPIIKNQCKIYKGNGSYFISLKKSFIEDSGCNFKEGDTLEICMVERDKMIIYKDEKNDS